MSKYFKKAFPCFGFAREDPQTSLEPSPEPTPEPTPEPSKEPSPKPSETKESTGHRQPFKCFGCIRKDSEPSTEPTDTKDRESTYFTQALSRVGIHKDPKPESETEKEKEKPPFVLPPDVPRESINAIDAYFKKKIQPRFVKLGNKPPKDAAQRADEHTQLSVLVVCEVLMKLDRVDIGDRLDLRLRRRKVYLDVDKVMRTLNEAMKKPLEGPGVAERGYWDTFFHDLPVQLETAVNDRIVPACKTAFNHHIVPACKKLASRRPKSKESAPVDNAERNAPVGDILEDIAAVDAEISDRNGQWVNILL